MQYYDIATIVILFAVVIHYLNERLLKIQATIAITIGALVIALVLIITQKLHWHSGAAYLAAQLNMIDFKAWLLNGVLGFLLFAGALTIDLQALRKYQWEVATLALLGTLASTFIVGTLIYYLLQCLGLPMSYLYCLLFGGSC